MSARPIRQATTTLKNFHKGHVIYSAHDRRGRLWVGGIYVLARAELVDIGRVKPRPNLAADKALRKALDAEDVRCVHGTTRYRDQSRTVPPDAVTLQVVEGPWAGTRIYAHADSILHFAEAAEHVYGGNWSWFASGYRKPLVLRRNRDRMAVATLMPISVCDESHFIEVG